MSFENAEIKGMIIDFFTCLYNFLFKIESVFIVIQPSLNKKERKINLKKRKLISNYITYNEKHKTFRAKQGQFI